MAPAAPTAPAGSVPIHHLPFTISTLPPRLNRVQLSSDPLQRSKQLLVKVQRSVSDRETDYVQFGPLSYIRLPDRDVYTTDRLRTAVFNVICKRLQQKNIDTSQLTESAIAWALPTSWQQENTYRLLLENPLHFPASLFDRFFDVEPSTADSPKVKASDNATKYYVRTFTIKVIHFRSILEQMVDDGYASYDQVPRWLKVTDGLTPLSTITVRYAGQTSKQRPWDRHLKDVASSSESSFIVRFFRSLASHCPDVLANASVQTLTRVSTNVKFLSRDIDLQEMVLIALLGDGTLNVEAGGKSSMNVTGDDHAAFAKLGVGKTKLIVKEVGSEKEGSEEEVTFVKLLEKELQPCPDTMRKAVKTYGRSVGKYVKANDSTTDGSKYAFTDQTQSIIVQQATPQVLPGRSTAVMLTLGSDIGELQDNQATAFFEGTSRASTAILDCFRYFALWEQDPTKALGQDANAVTIKQLARDGLLPFANLLPWFMKAEKDYSSARRLLSQYLVAIQPVVIVALGELQTFAMTNPIASFSKKAFDSRCTTNAVEEWGVPKLATHDGFWTVVIPCAHPGYLAHIGLLRKFAQSLVLQNLAIAWLAGSLAISINKAEPGLGRKQLCGKIIAEINSKLDIKDPFGADFDAAKKRFLDARTIYHETRSIRSKAAKLSKPPAGLLPGITQHIRRGRVVQVTDAVAAGVGGFELRIQAQQVVGAPKSDKVRFVLGWADDDGVDWQLYPILLPTKAVPENKGDKRFIFFVPNGIDIRDSSGNTVGTYKPISSGNTKTETLPLSSIILSMSEEPGLSTFLAYWEQTTGLKVDDLWNTADEEAAMSTKPFVPASWFEDSESAHALPFINKTLQKDAYHAHLSDLRKTLPASTGDMLWLLDRFLDGFIPTGGEIDLAAGSEHTNSVYRAIKNFCLEGTYRHHPHARTLRALVDIVEQGAAERIISTNALVFAFELLRGFKKKQPTSLKLNVNGEVRESKRFVVTLDQYRPKKAICVWSMPDLVSEVEVLSDVSVDAVSDVEGAEDDIVDPNEDSDVDEFGPAATASSSTQSSRKRGRKLVPDADDDEDREDPPASITPAHSVKKLKRTITQGGTNKKRP